MAVPNTFATDTGFIPLSELDANFAYYDAALNISGSNITALGAVTINTGTANGVPYLNGSKVLTTGAALQFDGNNLGLGVTPSAWGGSKAIEINAAGNSVWSTGSNNIRLSSGMYFNGTNALYSTTGTAVSQYRVDSGQHIWYTAPSGTAGNAISFTQAMTLDAGGRLLVGRTSSAGSQYSLELDNGSSDNRIGMYAGATLTGGLLCATNEMRMLGFGASTVLTFQTNGAERARIDSSGNLLVGQTAVGQAGIVSIKGSNGYGVEVTGTGGSAMNADYTAAAGTTGYYSYFKYRGTLVGSISSTGSTTTYATSSDYRLKNITGPITTSGAYIDSLNPVEGTWKADGSTFVGLIAHEVQEASRTQVATGTKDGEEMQAMDYSNAELIANLIAELQSLRKRVAQLERK